MPETHSSANSLVIKALSLDELQAIINRPSYYVKPCHPELATRFEGWYFGGVSTNPDIDPSDYRVLSDDVNSL